MASGQQAPIIQALATRGPRTYAILRTSGNPRTVLAVSDDRLRTWTPIDAGLATADYRAFWLNPTTGALLLLSWPSGGAFELWTTGDDGAHWARIPTPTALPGLGNYVANQPVGGEPWRICGTYLPSATTPGNALACTSDDGRTWAVQPAMAPNGDASVMTIAGLPADGSLLVVASVSGAGTMLYRLPAGATRWQALGSLPPASGGGVASACTEGGGALWSFPAESDGAGVPQPADAVYSAPYPS